MRRGHELVEHILGEGAMGGELAAIEGDEAAAAIGDAGERRAAGEPARFPPAMILQGADAGEAPHDVGGGGGPAPRRKVPVIGLEQIGCSSAEQAAAPGSPFSGTSVVPTMRKRRSSHGITKITRSSLSCKV